jgi:hypothetical protein
VSHETGSNPELFCKVTQFREYCTSNEISNINFERIFENFLRVSPSPVLRIEGTKGGSFRKIQGPKKDFVQPVSI